MLFPYFSQNVNVLVNSVLKHSESFLPKYKEKQLSGTAESLRSLIKQQIMFELDGLGELRELNLKSKIHQLNHKEYLKE